LTRRRRHEVQRFALAELIRIACIILAADDNDAFVEGVLSSSSSSRAAAAATGGAPNPSRQKTDFEEGGSPSLHSWNFGLAVSYL
jgi:hypothetical protein